MFGDAVAGGLVIDRVKVIDRLKKFQLIIRHFKEEPLGLEVSIPLGLEVSIPLQKKRLHRGDKQQQQTDILLLID